ncbi:MAG TPA: hypothetical protein VHC50_04460 [Puia sp.]|nr:hypothetical protein [Puia sp.]
MWKKDKDARHSAPDMPSYFVLVLFSYSILPAAVIAAYRYREVPAENRPFFFIVWAALLNEILSEVFSITFHNTAVNCNIYVLAEAILYCLLFYNWGSRRGNKNGLRPLIGFLVLVWVLDNLVLFSLNHTNSLFRVVSSFVLVFLAIDRINQLITNERGNLLGNARFLISGGVVIFFSYRAIVEVFYGLSLPFSNSLYQKIYIIMVYVNHFVNLIFALAALWIPTKQKFILPY